VLIFLGEGAELMNTEAPKMRRTRDCEDRGTSQPPESPGIDALIGFMLILQLHGWLGLSDPPLDRSDAANKSSAKFRQLQATYIHAGCKRWPGLMPACIMYVNLHFGRAIFLTMICAKRISFTALTHHETSCRKAFMRAICG
jgi:hypothetical protein